MDGGGCLRLSPVSTSAMMSNRNVIAVGKVVSGRVSRAVNVLFDLGKQYPNEIFSVFIKKEDLVNFGFEPVSFLKGKSIAVTGKVGDLGTAFMSSADLVRQSHA